MKTWAVNLYWNGSLRMAERAILRRIRILIGNLGGGMEGRDGSVEKLLLHLELSPHPRDGTVVAEIGVTPADGDAAKPILTALAILPDHGGHRVDVVRIDRTQGHGPREGRGLVDGDDA